MNNIRRLTGIIWMLAAPVMFYFLLSQAMKRIASAGDNANDILQWAIILLIFIPVAIGFIIFGYYAFKGEYDRK